MLDDDTPAVTVWPADKATWELFSKAPRIDDKEHKLDLVTNMQFVRWMEPGTIELVRRFEEGLPGEA